MSDAFWMAFFGFITSTATAVLALWNRRQSRLEHVETKNMAQETRDVVANGLGEKVEKIHVATIAVKDELEKNAEFIKGVAAGRAQVLAEQSVDKK